MREVYGVKMSKEAAKKMIDEAPGDNVTIFCVVKESGCRVHKQTEIRHKKYGKQLIDQAKEVTYDDLEMMGVLSLYEDWKSEPVTYRNIAFPQILI